MIPNTALNGTIAGASAAVVVLLIHVALYRLAKGEDMDIRLSDCLVTTISYAVLGAAGGRATVAMGQPLVVAVGVGACFGILIPLVAKWTIH